MTKTETKILTDNLRKLVELIIKELENREEAYEEGYRIGYQHGADDTDDKYVRSRDSNKN